MDFFHAQDQARAKTKWLVLFFLVAVALIIGLIYLVTILLVRYMNQGAVTHAPQVPWWSLDLFLTVAVVVSGVIFIGSLYKVVSLSKGGGVKVAEMLGGRRVDRGHPNDLYEKRLINVVDEMAIASGMPVPKVYVMENEQGINAFAAGTTPNNAVIAVTRGCLEKLDRDELQGVVAHEFSHIFNGDMRLNVKLIGILHGILLIALIGRIAMHSGGGARSRQSGGFVIIGLAIIIIGYVGVFFGNLIKAAVSRQREFLADASAVQYTRNPAGISSALKKIGGFKNSHVDHPEAEEASHMFFGQGIRNFMGLFATHPPVEERIRRIDPTFKAAARRAAVASAASPLASPEGAMGFGVGDRVAASPQSIRDSVGNPLPEHVTYARELLATLPQERLAALREPAGAKAVIYALLVAPESEPGQVLADHLQQEEDAMTGLVIAQLDWLKSAGKRARLPLLELCLSALRDMRPDEVEPFFENVERLVRADGKMSLFEFTLVSLLRHGLLDERAKPGNKEWPNFDILRTDCARLFSLLAYAGHHDPVEIEKGFNAALELAPLDGPWQMQPKAVLSVEVLDTALRRLGRTAYGFRGRIIEACVAAIAADGKVTVAEAELLRAIGARLDCPVPPLLPGSL
jgi:Zn-dependent protease with chaperone function